MSPWDLASVVLKLLTLLSTAVVLGGGFSLFFLAPREQKMETNILSYMLMGAGTGIVVTVLFFLAQIGGVNQAGLSGVFDIQIGGILAQSSLGYACGLRLLGFTSVFAIPLLTAWYNVTANKTSAIVCVVLVYSFIVLLLGSPFSLYGHVAELGVVARLAIPLHVVAVSWWIGSLFPLLLAFRMEDGDSLHTLMDKFGQLAAYIVGTLVLTGAYLTIRILESPNDFFQTSYGSSLLLKLVGVAGLLLLAASNKFFIVPNLDRAKCVGHLRSSISLEIMVAVLVIGTTAYFTTVVGITHG